MSRTFTSRPGMRLTPESPIVQIAGGGLIGGLTAAATASWIAGVADPGDVLGFLGGVTGAAIGTGLAVWGAVWAQNKQSVQAAETAKHTLVQTLRNLRVNLENAMESANEPGIGQMLSVKQAYDTIEVIERIHSIDDVDFIYRLNCLKHWWPIQYPYYEMAVERCKAEGANRLSSHAATLFCAVMIRAIDHALQENKSQSEALDEVIATISGDLHAGERSAPWSVESGSTIN